MRITNSTLRRIIAEEYAEILAETKKRDHSERVPGGQQHRAAMGWDEPEEEIDWEDEDAGDFEDFEGDEAGSGEIDPHKMGEYEHAYSMGGGSDEEGFAIDYDTGRPSPFAAKFLAPPGAAVDDIEGEEDLYESRWSQLAGLLRD
jgi:hypothetical protein